MAPVAQTFTFTQSQHTYNASAVHRDTAPATGQPLHLQGSGPLPPSLPASGLVPFMRSFFARACVTPISHSS